MGFQLSPSVDFNEIDLTNIVPAVSTTGGAFAGIFKWGPVGVRTLVDSELTLVKMFGEPDNFTANSFFTCANFLAYGNNLQIVRVVHGTDGNAAHKAKNATADGTGLLIKNIDDYNANYAAGQGAVGAWAAKYPGDLGNSIGVSYADAGNWGTWAYAQNFNGAPGTSDSVAAKGGSNDEIHVVVYDVNGTWTGTPGQIMEAFPFLSKASDGTKPDGSSNYYPTVINRVSTKIWWMDHATQGTSWGLPALNQVFETLTTTVVFTSITGGPYTVGETVYVGSSINLATKKGTVVSYNSGSHTLVIKPTLGVITTSDSVVGNTSSATGTPTSVTIPGVTFALAGGLDSSAYVVDADYINGYDLFSNDEGNSDISLLLTGDATTVISLHVLDSIAEVRRDCVVFISPQRSDVISNAGLEKDSCIATRNAYDSSSYAFMDSNWKYQYDKYNDINRWVPLNGDIAGLCVRTDDTRDPWYSPAGLNRGNIKNVIKLAWNPTKAFRDELYKNGINPVVIFPGEGAVLFGDKTMLAKPSAFDRINVRRLFIVLEKAISTAAKYMLFEFNDEFTRAQFRSMVEPFLRDVKGRRGMSDFLVVCDTTNNTPQVIDSNRFIGDIYIKPARSINFITLNFVATPTGVEFSEVVGKF